jgi:hypothetical protein
MHARIRQYVGTAAVAVLLFSATAQGQPARTVGETLTETFTIEAIDRSARIVSLKDKDGTIEDVVCGPEVKRFDELKVGQTVVMRYTESLVTMISRPGAAPKAPDAAAVTRSQGAPGATIARQQTTTVTLDAIDPKVPSVSITTADGRKMSFRIADAKNVEGFKPGDKVDVTYTQALAVEVQSAK